MSISSKAFALENAQVQKFQEIKCSCFPLTGLMKSGKIGHTNGVTVFWIPSKRNKTDLTDVTGCLPLSKKQKLHLQNKTRMLTQKQIAFYKEG